MDPARASERLDSWKEIAAYLRKGERTVRRWEQTERLPVHRHQHEGRSSIYAFPEELDRWLAERTVPAASAAELNEAVREPTRFPLHWKVGGALLLAGVVWLTVLRARHAESESAVYDARPLTALTGEESFPSFFPDGKRVAFLWGQAGKSTDVFIKTAGSEELRQVTRSPENELSPAVSPDGSAVAFLRVKAGFSSLVLYRVAEGREQEIADVATPHPSFYAAPGPFLSWLPDSKRLVIVNRNRNLGPTALYLHNVETGVVVQLTAPPSSAWGDSEPAVSPDGTSVAFSRSISVGLSDLYRMSLNSPAPAEELLVANKRWNRSPAWTPDGKEIVFTSGYWGHLRLVRIHATGHDSPRQIPGIGEGGVHPAISRDGQLAYTRYQQVTEILRLPLDGSGKAAGEPLSVLSTSRSELHPQVSPDGNWLAYHSDRSGSQEIWVARSDGTNARRITHFNGPQVGSARWAPDGTRLAFDGVVDGQYEIFVCDRDGKGLRRLTTNADADVLPRWSADGNSLYFASRRTGDYQVWRMPVSGGAPVQITFTGGVAAEESHDGKYIYYTRSDNDVNSVFRIPVTGGRELQFIEGVFGRRFTLARDGVYFQPGKTEKPSFAFKSFHTGGVQHVATVNSFLVNPICVSRDAKHLYYAESLSAVADLLIVPGFTK